MTIELSYIFISSPIININVPALAHNPSTKVCIFVPFSFNLCNILHIVDATKTSPPGVLR